MKLARKKCLRLVAAVAILTALPLLAQPAGAETATFSNTAAIRVPAPGPPPGCPSFPGPNNSCPPTPAIVNGTDVSSGIAVSGMTGGVTGVNVTLNDLTYTNYDASDLDILLVAPGGGSIQLMSDVCDNEDLTGQEITTPTDFTFDDDAATSVPADVVCSGGSYKPTDDDAPNEDFQFTGVDVFCGPYNASYPPGRCNPCRPGRAGGHPAAVRVQRQHPQRHLDLVRRRRPPGRRRRVPVGTDRRVAGA